MVPLQANKQLQTEKLGLTYSKITKKFLCFHLFVVLNLHCFLMVADLFAFCCLICDIAFSSCAWPWIQFCGGSVFMLVLFILFMLVHVVLPIKNFYR